MLSLLLSLVPALAAPPPPAVVPLRNAHAHNDYPTAPAARCARPRLLQRRGRHLPRRRELIVAHTWLGRSPGRTLEKLYLARCVSACQGRQGPGLRRRPRLLSAHRHQDRRRGDLRGARQAPGCYADVFSVAAAALSPQGRHRRDNREPSARRDRGPEGARMRRSTAAWAT